MVLLGIGEDGHIASLFPQSEVEEPHPWSVIAKYDDLLRISLPYEVIGAATRVVFLATGIRKKSILNRIFHPLTGDDEDLPASLLYRHRPDAIWFLDGAAGE
jgi:6-phosphogluconolactonase